jgi:transcriptional regulator with XRE-family HTH domain
MGMLWDLIQRHIDNAPYPPSERQVARRLEVSPNTLAHWRDLKRLPSRGNLQAIADLVGVRYSVVLEAALHDTGYHEGGGEHASGRPVEPVRSELEAAEVNLAEFDELPVSGEAAVELRAELQARVDRLRGESLSRDVTGESRSVTKS